MCRWLPPFFEHKHHIAYSQIENPQEIDEIRHPAIRETLRFLKITEGVEIHHAADLPARAGMGTSAAFTVGLLHAFYALQGISPTKMQLTLDAIHVEQDMIKEPVGSQDQVAAAFGGFNRIDFTMDGTGHRIKITPIKSERLNELGNYLMLLFTGLSRTASHIAKEQIERTHNNAPILREMYAMVDEGVKILTGSGSLLHFGKLLDEGWKLKRRLSEKISTNYIDYIYTSALNAGAIGGKLLGAGGGGFILFWAEPDSQSSIKKALSSLLHVPFRFEPDGSQNLFKKEGA